ncbi:MAG: hypothetical protein NVSMB58_16360 [Terriglobales bacterium]
MKIWLGQRLATVFAILLVAAMATLCGAQAVSSEPFGPLEHWKSAIIKNDATSLRTFYSTNPAAKITTKDGEVETEGDIEFWKSLNVRKLGIDVVESNSSQPGQQQLVLQLKIKSAGSPHPRTLYVSESQLWQQQGEQWRLVAVQRTEPARLQQPLSVNKDLYPTNVDAHAEIHEAMERATKLHKRVLVVFGANWCFDCHVLDAAFHRPDLAPIVTRNYEVVHVDIGRGEKNQDLMEQYQVPMKKGIPGIAVLASDGKLLFSQKNGQFEKARALGPEDLLAFLNKWKTTAR